MRTVILASSSPQRKELFKKLGVQFKAVPSDFYENLNLSLSPRRLAMYLARGKAEAVRKKYPKTIIVAADTIVVFGKKVLGKPKTCCTAQKMLKMLSGKCHSVITGFTIIDGVREKSVSGFAETKVYFRKLSSEKINRYIRSGEPLDKAGAYAIQGRGAIFVDKIEGDYYNVVGFPLSRIANALKSLGVKSLS